MIIIVRKYFVIFLMLNIIVHLHKFQGTTRINVSELFQEQKKMVCGYMVCVQFIYFDVFIIAG